MSKKINPRRIPATQADVYKAWNKGADFGMNFCLKVFLFILKDKHDASDKDILQLNAEFGQVIDAYNRGDINPEDLDSVLIEDFNLTVRLK